LSDLNSGKLLCSQGVKKNQKMDNLEDLKIVAEQWSKQGLEFVQKIPPPQLYTAIGVLLLATIWLLSSK